MKANPTISVVIPHKNRHGMLLWHLNKLCHQSWRDFEVVVVDDHSLTPWTDSISKEDLDRLNYSILILDNPENGPAAARNFGATHSKGEIVLFVGDDCIPHPDLLFRHVLVHKKARRRAAVQGYSPFHSQVMGTRFMHWLDNTGMQANWAACRHEDGTVKEDVSGFCLTTNYSINRQEFIDCGMFDMDVFKDPAWEDVAFGYTYKNLGGVTYFDPNAVNYHFHEYTAESFGRRQYMVGKNAWNLGVKYSELINGIIEPEQMRTARGEEYAEWLQLMRDVTYFNYRATGEEKVRTEIWGNGIRLALLKGLLAGADERGKYWQVFEHLHSSEQVVYALEGIRGVMDDHYGWSAHCMTWLIEENPENWASLAYMGEIYRAYGMRNEAYKYFLNSLEEGSSTWAKQAVEEMEAG